jgi:hypothetical protein
VNTEPPAPRIGVISGRYPASPFESYVNHRAYCAKHGYTYIYCNWPTGAANRYMNKLEYVRAYYHLFDYLFWIDDDAFFMRLDQRLEDFLPKGDGFLSICASPVINGIFTHISSGQFMLQCSDVGRSFIDESLSLDLERVRRWWTDDLGHFTRGDQDCFIYLMKNDDRFVHYDRHDYRLFNSRASDLISGDDVFILHITYPGKRRKYRDIQRHLARGPSLLPQDEVERWNLWEPPSLSTRMRQYMMETLRTYVRFPR